MINTAMNIASYIVEEYSKRQKTTPWKENYIEERANIIPKRELKNGECI